MKKLWIVAFVVLAAAACTPEQANVWNALQVDPVPVISPTDRAAGLSLPATSHIEVVHGETVNVVAYVGDDGESRGYFVYDNSEGRWLVILNSEPAHAYVYRVTADPCFTDPFGVVAFDPTICGPYPI